MEVQVPAQQLQIGMFVARLDRPWLDTPFLMQGFLIEDEETLSQVRRHCAVATVESGLSRAGLFPDPSAAQIRLEPPARGPVPLRMEVVEEAVVEERARRSLLDAVREFFRRARRKDAAAEREPILYEDLRAFREELPAAREAQAKALDVVRNFLDHVGKGAFPDMEQVTMAVTLVVESMVRNPSAMLWLSTLKERGGYLYAHAVDSAIYMVAFGRQLGFTQQELVVLGTAGMMMDVGKLKLPRSLLAAPGDLDEDQRAKVRRHVKEGVRMLMVSEGVPEGVVDIVARHHERFDGSGYPEGLRAEEIGMYATMAGIVDTFTAIIGHRPHAKARPISDALRVLGQLRGTLFHDAMVDQFIQCIGIYPVGSVVELSTGDVGIVVEVNRTRRLKPKVMLVLAPDKQPYRKPMDLDLATDPKVGDAAITIRRELPPGAHGLRHSDYFL